MDAIHIVGAGGIGCALGYALRKANVNVTFVETNPNKISYGRRFGVAIEGQTPFNAEFVNLADWSPRSDAIVLLCTKCYDNAAVLARLPESARFVPVQNGFDSQLDARGHEVEGISEFVSECADDRPVTRITRRGLVHFGGRGHGVPAWFRPFIPLCRLGELFYFHEAKDIRPFKYAKLMYNAAISPLAAAAGMDNGKLLSIPQARRLFFAMLRENFDILTGAGIALGKVGPFHPRTVNWILQRHWLAGLLARAFEPGLRGTYCSMSGDLPKGRTEIANYNGRLVELAGERPCPLNRRAVEVVTRMERERILPHLGALAWFEKA
ncbi:MAG: ketopantoate reductase family protein [Gemmataceae bacterium]